MGNLGTTLNTATMPQATSYLPLPVGDYVCMIKETEVKDTYAKNGKYIKFTFEVLQGDFTGRKLFSQINFMNPNDKAVEIGLSQLNKLCECGGLQAISDSNELVNVTCALYVGIEKDNKGEDRNVVKAYKLPQEAKPSPTKAQQQVSNVMQSPMRMPPQPAPQHMGFAPPLQQPAPQMQYRQQPAPVAPVAPAQPQQYQAPQVQYQPLPQPAPTQQPSFAQQLDDDIPF